MITVQPPKVNPELVPAYNESHEFTRRKPTYLSKKQEERDNKIARQIAQAYDSGDASRCLDIFFRKCHLLSNPVYWEILRTVWVGCGSTVLTHRFRPLMLSKRGARSWFMTVEDRKTFDNMKFPIMLYRAYDSEPDEGISWTSDWNWCEKYARMRNRKIKSRTFNKDEIYAYISRRGENEFLIL